MNPMPIPAAPLVGRVLRANVSEFTLGCRALGGQLPAFGSLVRVAADRVADPQAVEILGVVADLRLEDDPFVRQLVAAEVSEEYINDQRDRRQVPIEVRVIHAGFFDARAAAWHALPPRPPLALEQIFACSADEVRRFCAPGGPGERAWKLGFLALLVEAQAGDALLSAVLVHIAQVFDGEARVEFAREAGRELARLLSADVLRLSRLLPQIGQTLTGAAGRA
jgi:hypothetical protein